MGTSTRSLDGARAIYGGQVGSDNLVSPTLTAGKIVVFTVPLSATTGRRDWRFATFGPLTQYANAAGIVAISLDVVPRLTAQRLRGQQVHIRLTPTVDGPAPLALLVTPEAGAAASRCRPPSMGSPSGMKGAPSAETSSSSTCLPRTRRAT